MIVTGEMDGGELSALRIDKDRSVMVSASAAMRYRDHGSRLRISNHSRLLAIDFALGLRSRELGSVTANGGTWSFDSEERCGKLSVTGANGSSVTVGSHVVSRTDPLIGGEALALFKFGVPHQNNRYEIGRGDGVVGPALREQNGLSIVAYHPAFNGGEFVVPQEMWNVDTFDGSGGARNPSGRRVTTLSDGYHEICGRDGGLAGFHQVLLLDGDPFYVFGPEAAAGPQISPFDSRFRVKALNIGVGVPGEICLRGIHYSFAALGEPVTTPITIRRSGNDLDNITTTPVPLFAIRTRATINGIYNSLGVIPVDINCRVHSGTAIFDGWYVLGTSSTLQGATWAINRGTLFEVDEAASSFTPAADAEPVFSILASNGSESADLTHQFGFGGKRILRRQFGTDFQEYLVVTCRATSGQVTANAVLEALEQGTV